MAEIRKITIILRGYDRASVLKIAREADEHECFSLEITANSGDWQGAIEDVRSLHLRNVSVGAGTVLNMELLKQACEAGAEFALSPVVMSSDMLEYCRTHQMKSVPGTMSPSEVQQMRLLGADVIKIFPAARLTPKYFTDIMAPLGHLPLMAVGGVNAGNLREFIHAGAEYAGIGSGICSRQELLDGDERGLKQSLEELSEIVAAEAWK